MQQRRSMHPASIAAFYELARDMAEAEHHRFEKAEEKAWRHLYALVVLLGFAFLASGRTAHRLIEAPAADAEIYFVGAFGIFVLSALSAGFVSIWNLRVALLLQAPADRSIEEFAAGSSLERFHFEMGREFMRAAHENRQIADRKYRLLVWSFRLLVTSLILGIVLGVLFFLLPRGS